MVTTTTDKNNATNLNEWQWCFSLSCMKHKACSTIKVYLYFILSNRSGSNHYSPRLLWMRLLLLRPRKYSAALLHAFTNWLPSCFMCSLVKPNGKWFDCCFVVLRLFSLTNDIGLLRHAACYCHLPFAIFHKLIGSLCRVLFHFFISLVDHIW